MRFFFFFLLVPILVSAQDAPKIGVICAHPLEAALLKERLGSSVTEEIEGKRFYHSGEWHNIPVVLSVSRPGKVAAATCAAHLILRHQCNFIIIAGVAGAIDPSLKKGDVVIGEATLQHDLNGSPFIAPMVIPMLNEKELYTDPSIRSRAYFAAELFVAEDLPRLLAPDVIQQFGLVQPKVREGIIATGDQAIATGQKRLELAALCPNASCVEMEGAAAAQVCFEYGVPFLIIRTISDGCDDLTTDDFRQFMRTVAPVYVAGIVDRFIGLLEESKN